MYHIITFSYNLFIQFHEFELVAECASLHISGGISVRTSASHFLFVCNVVGFFFTVFTEFLTSIYSIDMYSSYVLFSCCFKECSCCSD